MNRAAILRAGGCLLVAASALFLAYESFAASRPAIIPASWTVPAWAIDESNITTCASDSNNCTSTTCGAGGVGPCLTPDEIYARWGTHSPRIRQSTTITELSSSTTNAHPRYWEPIIENGAVFTITGPALSTLSTGTLGVTTAKNRASNTFPFKSTFNASGAAGRFFSCVHAGTTGFGWLNTSLGANLFTTSQPLSATTTAATAFSSITEVDTCVQNDNFTLYNAFPAVNIATLRPTFVDWDGGFDNFLTLVHLTVFDPSGATSDPMYIGDHVAILESSFQRMPIVTAPISEAPVTIFVNVTTPGGIVSAGASNEGPSSLAGAGGLTPIEFLGGSLGGPNVIWCQLNGAELGADILVNGEGFRTGGNTGPTFVDNGNFGTLVSYGPTSDGVCVPASATLNTSGKSAVSDGGIVYGGGTLNVQGASRFGYLAGASKAATAFPITTIKLNGATTGCTPANGGTFTQNGITEVNTTGKFPANAVVAFSNNSIGTTPCVGSLYFDKATTANNFFTKNTTANCNDVMNWQAQPTCGVTVSAANLDSFLGATSGCFGSTVSGGAAFCNFGP